MSTKTTAIILAAGSGRRLKAKTDKPFIRLAGKPLLYYSLKAFQSHSQINGIILVCRKNKLAKSKQLVKKYRFSKVEKIIAGGKRRADSAINGLKQIDENTGYVLIHDSARPLVTKKLITRTINTLRRYKAVIPGFSVKDTLKYAGADLTVKKTLNRENLYHIQTPQGFRTSLIPQMMRNSKRFNYVYDDSILIEKNTPVKIINSGPENLKITTRADLSFAEFLLAKKSE